MKKTGAQKFRDLLGKGDMLVSPGVTRPEAEKLGLAWAADGKHALEMALEKQGRSATVAVLRHGGHILPLADERAAALHHT